MTRFSQRLISFVVAFTAVAIALPRGGLYGAEVVRDHEQEQPPRIRFAAVELFIDSGEAPLAAWQVELRAVQGSVRIVGIENGAHPAFGAAPPYYDPDAMMNDRVILAQYSLARAGSLPAGRTRIATVHIQIVGAAEPEFALDLRAAGDDQGRRIAAEVTLEMRTDQ